MTRKDKALIAEKGILSTSNPKLGKRLNDDALEKVKNFYNSDDVSRLMPGMKDCITVKIDESRMRVQKKLILGNLKEICQFFQRNTSRYSYWIFKICRASSKELCYSRWKWYPLCLCMYLSPECLTNDKWWQIEGCNL